MVFKQCPTMLVALLLLLPEVLLVSGEDDESSDVDYKAICKRFDAYYRKKFPDAERSPCKVLYDYPSFTEQFKEYMEANHKTYKSDKEQRLRFANFAANLVFMLEMGKKQDAFTMAVNGFADMSPEEFHQTHLGLNDTDLPVLGASPPTGQDVPPSIDWVAMGGVTTPVNQGSCNSCWTFATTGALEGAWFALTGKLVDLSEQQFLECTGGKLGCANGGNLITPYKKVAMKFPVCTDSSYPYTGKQGTCHQTGCTAAIPHGAVTGFKAVQPNSEQAMKESLVKTGPVAVGIDAMGNEVMFYKSGVLTAPCSDRLNHAVLVVGYGVQDPHPYWKLKNSWGKRWGEDGFFRLVRGLEGSGECGLKTQPTIPIVTTAGVTVPSDVVEAPAATLGSAGEERSPYLILVLAVVLGGAAGGCVFLMLCVCCAGKTKTRGADVAPLYSPVCTNESSSDDEDTQGQKGTYGHLRH